MFNGLFRAGKKIELVIRALLREISAKIVKILIGRFSDGSVHVYFPLNQWLCLKNRIGISRCVQFCHIYSGKEQQKKWEAALGSRKIGFLLPKLSIIQQLPVRSGTEKTSIWRKTNPWTPFKHFFYKLEMILWKCLSTLQVIFTLRTRERPMVFGNWPLIITRSHLTYSPFPKKAKYPPFYLSNQPFFIPRGSQT